MLTHKCRSSRTRTAVVGQHRMLLDHYDSTVNIALEKLGFTHPNSMHAPALRIPTRDPTTCARGRRRSIHTDARAALGGQRRRAQVVLHGFVMLRGENRAKSIGEVKRRCGASAASPERRARGAV